VAGMGSVYQRSSDKRWVGKYMVTDPLTGKTKPKYVYSSKEGRKGEQEVKRKLNKLIEEVEAGDLSSVNTITVKGWLQKYLDVYCADLAQTTLDGYRNYIENHINPVIGKIQLCDLKPIHIQNYYNHERNVPRYRTRNKDGKKVPILKDEKPVPLMRDGKPVIGYSGTTILQQHRILHRAFEKAVADGLIKRNPCDGVDAPSPNDFNPNIYTEEEFALLLDKLQGHRMEAIILIAGMCGLRRGELLALTWEDIDFKNRTITIDKNTVPTSKGMITKKPKTKKSKRVIAIPSVIMPALKRLRGIGKILTRQDGKDYNPGSVSREFKQFLEDNGLRHIRLHDLRHFNATMMLKNEVSEREAQERLGHSNPMMTKRYQHVLKDMAVSSADKLNNVLKREHGDGVNFGVK
jgi:integrase